MYTVIDDTAESILNAYLKASGREELRGMTSLEDYLMIRNQAAKEVAMGLHGTARGTTAEERPAADRRVVNPVAEKPEYSTGKQATEKPVFSPPAQETRAMPEKTKSVSNIPEKKKQKTAEETFLAMIAGIED